MEEILNMLLDVLDKEYKNNGSLIVDAIIDCANNHKFDIDEYTSALKVIHEGVDERILKNISDEKRKEYFNACYKISSIVHAETSGKIHQLKLKFVEPTEKNLENMTKEELIDYIKNKK